MSVYIDIAVNDEEIGHLVITRVEAHIGPNNLHSYRWRYTGKGPGAEATGWVEHRYGDGAMALVAKATKPASRSAALS